MDHYQPKKKQAEGIGLVLFSAEGPISVPKLFHYINVCFPFACLIYEKFGCDFKKELTPFWLSEFRSDLATKNILL